MDVIKNILQNKNTISFEVFPPKKENDYNLEGIFNTIKELKNSNPDFISVTFGTGGKNKNRAVKIAGFIESQGIVPLSHLTCFGYLKSEVSQILDELYNIGVKNILALRGDIPTDNPNIIKKTEFKLAKDLIYQIKKDGRFCIGSAIYPEGHNDCKDIDLNIEYAKIKQDNGSDFFITQLFFDNNNFYEFLNKCEQKNINIPILPGIMPVIRASQINRIIELTDTKVPKNLQRILDKYRDNNSDMEKAGLEFAVNQITDLLNNQIKGIHIYTMNKSEQTIKILNSLKEN